MARRQYKQGIFKPSNPQKYNGSYPLIYRSSYEIRFFRWADTNPNVVSWGSESVVIPYFDPVKQKVRRYFVDNNITVKTPTGGEIKYLIEIKPACKTVPPVAKKHSKSLLRAQAEYINNKAKWDAAQQWSKKNNHEFVILTEKELGIKR